MATPFDPYNLSEIEKIQLEIENEFEKDTSEEPVPQPMSESAVSESVLAFPQYEPPSHFPKIEAPPQIVEKVVETPDTFYTETIKQVKPSLSHRLQPYRRLIASLLIICTIGTGTLGIGLGYGLTMFQNRSGIVGVQNGNNPEDVTRASGGTRLVFDSESNNGQIQEGTLADIVELVDPAVVRITPVHNQISHPFLDRGLPQQQPDGSGIIFAVDNEQIFIVTNYHVTSGANSVYVSIMDSEPIAARPIGRNAVADIIVISVSLMDARRVGVEDVRIAVFGDSDIVRVGDVVLAIGNAMGEGNATTSGIISAAEKEIVVGVRSPRGFRVLQTDAAINPGSSGGPLINKRGEVIGINSHLISSDQNYAIEGMGFSIPSNVAKPIIQDIMNAIPQPFLGVGGENIREEDARQLNIPPMGIYITRVFPNSSAYHAGLQRADIITSFAGRAIFDMDQLREEVRRHNIGDTVEVVVLRNGREQITLTVVLGSDHHDNF